MVEHYIHLSMRLLVDFLVGNPVVFAVKPTKTQMQMPMPQLPEPHASSAHGGSWQQETAKRDSQERQPRETTENNCRDRDRRERQHRETSENMVERLGSGR